MLWDAILLSSSIRASKRASSRAKLQQELSQKFSCPCQGLRGSRQSVVWRDVETLSHWKPDEVQWSEQHNFSSDVRSYVPTRILERGTWQTCNSWKMQS